MNPCLLLYILIILLIYRQAGKQIQGVINSAYKIERQAGGMRWP